MHITQVIYNNLSKRLEVSFSEMIDYNTAFFLNGHLIDDYNIENNTALITPMYYYFTSVTENNLLMVKHDDTLIEFSSNLSPTQPKRFSFKLIDILQYPDYYISFETLFQDDISEIFAYDIMRETDNGVMVYNDLAIYQGIENILNTTKGEKLFDIEFGTSFNEILFNRQEIIDEEALKNEIAEAINRYELRCMTKPELISLEQIDNYLKLTIVVVKNSTKEPLTYSRVFSNT